jgi:hypothetical protein
MLWACEQPRGSGDELVGRRYRRIVERLLDPAAGAEQLLLSATLFDSAADKVVRGGEDLDLAQELIDCLVPIGCDANALALREQCDDRLGRGISLARARRTLDQ